MGKSKKNRIIKMEDDKDDQDLFDPEGSQVVTNIS